MKIRLLSLAIAAALMMTACSGAPNEGSSAPADSGQAKTFAIAVSSDPGALDPAMSPATALLWASALAYDPLVNMDVEGNVTSGLAEEWNQDGLTITMKMKSGVTCADGSEFKASTAAANINFVADEKNASPLLGVYVPAGAQATADDASAALTIKLAEAAPFAISSLSNLMMVCDAGLADRTKLTAATYGTGPYTLKEAVPNDHYTYELRAGYKWGPGGQTNTEAGQPASVNVRIIPNETTAANMLLSKELNAALILGPDTQRLDSANLFAIDAMMVLGEQWHNEAADHVTSDPAIRKALAQAVNLEELRAVLTSGKGLPPTTLETSDPVPCPGDPIKSVMPTFDAAGAASALDASGWKKGADGVRVKDGKPLAIDFIYDTVLGDGAAAAAELAQKAWTDLGVKVKVQGLPTDQLQPILFGTGAWDIAWEAVNLSSPDQFTALASGPGATEGGMNFGSISNKAYDAKVAEAMKIDGQKGCPTWHEADNELVKAVDILPFANSVIRVYGNGASFARSSYIIPTSIRVTD